jgi:polyisoprenoid-binding protein YceI
MKGMLLAVVLAVASPIWAETWNVDPAHSGVQFSIRHFFTPVPGRFNDFTGTIVYDAAKPAEASVEFTVQASSIDTQNGDRDNHLRSPDFFDVEKHPTWTFKSTGVKPAGEGKLNVTGDLTIHGMTKKVTIPVAILGALETPMGHRAGFSTEFTIDRKEYGVSWNRALDSGGAILGEDVKIEINIEAVKAQAAAAK